LGRLSPADPAASSSGRDSALLNDLPALDHRLRRRTASTYGQPWHQIDASTSVISTSKPVSLAVTPGGSRALRLQRRSSASADSDRAERARGSTDISKRLRADSQWGDLACVANAAGVVQSEHRCVGSSIFGDQSVADANSNWISRDSASEIGERIPASSALSVDSAVSSAEVGAVNRHSIVPSNSFRVASWFKKLLADGLATAANYLAFEGLRLTCLNSVGRLAHALRSFFQVSLVSPRNPHLFTLCAAAQSVSFYSHVLTALRAVPSRTRVVFVDTRANWKEDWK
jgi:hypothetical protein